MRITTTSASPFSTLSLPQKQLQLNAKDDDIFTVSETKTGVTTEQNNLNPSATLSILTASLVWLCLPSEASAASAATPLASAAVAYVHYASLVIMAACLTIERFTVKPGMSQEEQELLSNADIAYGISGLAIAVSGYLRVVTYGKGIDFYSHEPIFWLKICLVGIFGALSFFPTTKIIQRAIIRQKEGQFPEMSEKLANRMKSIMNAEITAILSIPLSATLMSRGIGYTDAIPWQAEAAVSALIFAGASFKYVKEALDFED
jgi:putative membrane protein